MFVLWCKLLGNDCMLSYTSDRHFVLYILACLEAYCIVCTSLNASNQHVVFVQVAYSTGQNHMKSMLVDVNIERASTLVEDLPGESMQERLSVCIEASDSTLRCSVGSASRMLQAQASTGKLLPAALQACTHINRNNYSCSVGWLYLSCPLLGTYMPATSETLISVREIYRKRIT